MTDLVATAPSSATALPGRRERKKQATRRAIRHAALTLALERGVERLTVEDISDAADVAPRTFFNYFSCKEDALIADSGDATAELCHAIATHPADEPPLRVLRMAIGHSTFLDRVRDRREEVLARHQLVRENPSLLPRQLAQYAALEQAVTTAMAARIGVDPDIDLRPSLLASVAVSVIRLAMHRWAADREAVPGDIVDAAFDLLQRGPL